MCWYQVVHSSYKLVYNHSKYRYIYHKPASWWFGTCFIFHNIWDNLSHWLSYFQRGRYTTNQYRYIYHKPAGSWFGTFLFSTIYGIIFPIDCHIFRGVGIPPISIDISTINQLVRGLVHFFIFHNIWDNLSHWLSYFQRGWYTTNQYRYIYHKPAGWWFGTFFYFP